MYFGLELSKTLPPKPTNFILFIKYRKINLLKKIFYLLLLSIFIKLLFIISSSLKLQFLKIDKEKILD